MVEEKLTFYKMQEPAMNFVWSDIKCREVVEQVYGPTEKRMLEIQDKFGEMCKMFVDMETQNNKTFHKLE